MRDHCHAINIEYYLLILNATYLLNIDLYTLPPHRLTNALADAVSANFYARVPPNLRPSYLRDSFPDLDAENESSPADENEKDTTDKPHKVDEIAKKEDTLRTNETNEESARRRRADKVRIQKAHQLAPHHPYAQTNSTLDRPFRVAFAPAPVLIPLTQPPPVRAPIPKCRGRLTNR